MICLIGDILNGFQSYILITINFLTPLIAKRASHILTVSEFSRKEIIDCLKVEENKVSVIYNAVSQNFINKKLEDIKENTFEYILAVSSIDPRKNFSRLLCAVNLLKTNIKLVIIGNSNNVFQKINLELSSRVSYLGHVSDEELKIYYSNAKLFVYPSVYEGFGLPPLEAMAMGCPTIVSDIEVFHEVFDMAAKYFNPYDINDIATCIENVLSSSKIREKLTREGTKLVRKYSWNQSAIIIIEITKRYNC